MAIISQYRTWNGIQTKQEVDTETGVIEVFAIDSGILGIDEKIARSDGNGNDWEITNSTILRNEYNKANKTRLTKFQINRKFFIKDYKIFNNDRAAVLNNADNFDSTVDYAIAIERFFKKKVPGITNPNDGRTVSPTTGGVTELQVIPFVQSGSQTERGAENVESPLTAAGQVITVAKNAAEQDSKSIPTPTPEPKVESGGVLRYPLANLEVVENITGITYDYIKINIQDWVSSMSDGKHSIDAVSRYKETKGSLKTIILPMTNGLGTQNGINWGEGNGNSIQLALAASVGDLITNVAEADLDGKINAAKGSLEKALTSAQGFLKEAGDQKAAVAALLSGYVIGNTSFATRQSGLTINPNMELLFSGPQLRSFGFKFDFAPRFKEEAEQVREIIKTFKMFSSPVITKTGSIFLETPKIFQLEYIYNGDGSDTADGNTHPYLNKIKPCALTTVGVNYTPNGTYMTYAGGGSMVQTTLTLSFKELEPIYNIDYDDGHPTGY